MSLALIFIGILSVILPGFFLALALLRKTKLNIFEIFIIGIIFGIIFPPAMTWAEAYLIPYAHAFSFSAGIYNANVIILTIIGVALSAWQGAFNLEAFGALYRSEEPERAETGSDYRKRLSDIREKMQKLNMDLRIIKGHEREEKELDARHSAEIKELRAKGTGREELESIEEMHRREERKLFEGHEREERLLINGAGSKDERREFPTVWIILALLMIITFASRIVNLSVAPKFFEFDPYFDMMSAQWILTYGYQLKYDTSAWPGIVNGSVHRIQPLVPYLEAYWYQLESPNSSGQKLINTTLLSKVSSVYPPLAAALLVFVIFMFVYHEYGKLPGMIAAAFAAGMPVLITTFIAGEQLLEPWGITTLFFFFAAYLLAVKNPKEPRFAILAGIAFASTFLGAHYYTVDAGILAAYIAIQGIIDILRRRKTWDFYRMNIILLAVMAVSYALYAPYGATLTNRIPSILGIPTVIGFPLFALIIVMFFEYLLIFLNKQFNVKLNSINYGILLVVFIAILGMLVIFTPIGRPVKGYLSLSEKFTTPSSALFMTVQEYTPTGPNFNFGQGGFGFIGSSIFGVAIIVWIVLLLFAAFSIFDIAFRDSRSSVLTILIVAILALAGMSEVKYLPHFGVAYILAISVVFADAYIIIKRRGRQYEAYMVAGVGLLIAVAEFSYALSPFTAIGVSCSNIAKQGNAIGYDMFCNTLTNAWLNATAWMRENVGPYAPRILSWWDYGDWINWFGNSNAVIRGDNANATFDYRVAAQYVLGVNDSYGSKSMAEFMNRYQTGYALFDDQLIPKWSALDFLACVSINQTSRGNAIAQGKAYGVSYLIGTSQCELNHDPVDVNIPVNPSISEYCSFPNSNITAVKGIVTIGETVPELLNQTYCVGLNPINNSLPVYTSNGMLTNVILPLNLDQGQRQLVQGSSEVFADFMALYLPNGPNGTVTNAPTYFYNSNYYRAFFFGKLPGFTLAYPQNFSGINFVGNTSQTVMIFKLDNYTGGTPSVAVKPSWISNNYEVPG